MSVNVNSFKELQMQAMEQIQVCADVDPARAASHKLVTGALMTLTEVAAMLDIAPATVHVLPLPPIRVGRQYRFDPKDVRHFIEANKEAVRA